MMKKTFFLVAAFLFTGMLYGQTVTQQLAKAWQAFEADYQLANATASLYVIDAETGDVIFSKNEKLGLAPASTQKIITAATAFAFLGKDYRYATQFGLLNEGTQKALYIQPSGDPSLGSWRWGDERNTIFLQKIKNEFQWNKNKLSKNVFVNIKGWDQQSIPNGWIWQDIGNYYGAGAGFLNWRENQFDLVLRSGSRIGDPVEVVKTIPALVDYQIHSLATAASAGSGDNAYLYFPITGHEGIVRGTIPVHENKFVISGAMPNPERQFISTVKNAIDDSHKDFDLQEIEGISTKPEILLTQYSPTLDSLVYWFLKKSINLYGEALLKTIGLKEKGSFNTDAGIDVVKDFWKGKGIDVNELHIEDGSGLSPQNRVTTHAQATILRYALGQIWFPEFYEALPVYNGMKMKSGTIYRVKGFCGYQINKSGQGYIFSILVNNYSGSTAGVVAKMYKVLNELK
ncbi:MAG: D-alanyl-D-alanine carboxypeptidase/D-alanyl-D-alanine-endopeptidase [Chitinophagaceae bacterium]|nr:D-alanyl-D-alanine carboxypeptidase/D-alanyl-D-alanine-endopeptidase [Chitinophagaceae bacterium]